MSILLFGGLVLVLLTLHELSHILTAKLLKLKIDRIGFTLKPYPHPYVAVSEVESYFSYFVFLFAGIVCTLLLFTAAYVSGLLQYKLLYYAFAFELIIECNPFHSDITIATNSPRFGRVWYIHFTLWCVLIYVLFSPNMLMTYALR